MFQNFLIKLLALGFLNSELIKVKALHVVLRLKIALFSEEHFSHHVMYTHKFAEKIIAHFLLCVHTLMSLKGKFCCH